MHTAEMLTMDLIVLGTICLSIFISTVILCVLKEKINVGYAVIISMAIFVILTTGIIFGLEEIGWIVFPPVSNSTICTNLTRITP